MQLPGVERFEDEPALDWLRRRDPAAADRLLAALQPDRWPLRVAAPPWLVVNANWAPDRVGKTLWVHLLNVSTFYPGGDTGFRGMGAEPVYAGEVASDARIAPGGRVVRIHQPVHDAAIAVADRQVTGARLGVADEQLSPAADGSYTFPQVDLHDVLVFEFP